MVLAEGWQERLVPVRSPATQGVTGHCLSPADLAISKLAAGRDKDMAFVSALLLRGYVSAADVESLIPAVPSPHRTRVTDALRLCVLRAQRG